MGEHLMGSKRAKKTTGRKMPVSHGTTLMQSEQPRRIEIHLAPPPRAERQHARPGAGIKRARAAMLPKSRARGSRA
jgi:hypothetical protein